MPVLGGANSRTASTESTCAVAFIVSASLFLRALQKSCACFFKASRGVAKSTRHDKSSSLTFAGPPSTVVALLTVGVGAFNIPVPTLGRKVYECG